MGTLRAAGFERRALALEGVGDLPPVPPEVAAGPLPAAAVALAFRVFGLHVWGLLATGHSSPLEHITTFYNDLFTVMIFTDVLVLILSLNVSGRYEMVFRNAAFIVSIILLRFSLTETAPYGAPLALLAMAFGVLTLLLFNFLMRIERDNPSN